ncbi:hypothetical protein D5E69_22625 (plasmid) [Rossellomorea marisflavi]|jgi:hypothetical protein|uniref:hypothetical protein n=1 Tax=Rossellomorea marisflavi TaxID=189381 RepID=UPI001315D109|nr:hypothetical protein [Rossellomorea marisflavi]QHA38640.1 hypothetical protein D5E69_22625 [Rossellomorea marisflavi]
MSVVKETPKYGKVKFRSQKEINEERRQKREKEIRSVTARVKRIISSNYQKAE